MPIQSVNIAIITMESDFRSKRNRHYKILISETKGSIQEELFGDSRFGTVVRTLQ